MALEEIGQEKRKSLTLNGHWAEHVNVFLEKSPKRLGAQSRMHAGEWWKRSALQRGKSFGEVLEGFDGGKGVERGQEAGVYVDRNDQGNFLE